MEQSLGGNYGLPEELRSNVVYRTVFEDFCKADCNEGIVNDLIRAMDLEREELEAKSTEEIKTGEIMQQPVWEQEKEEKEYLQPERRGRGFLTSGRWRKQKQKEDYRERMREKLFGMKPLAVCEETIYAEKSQDIREEEKKEEEYGEEYGKTIYIEDKPSGGEPGLYKTDGELVMKLTEFPFIIGKKKENVNLAINDYSVSRVHARITEEEGVLCIEDLNSTNGTFKNGLRLQPYEKRKLEREDELRFGKTEYIYR